MGEPVKWYEIQEKVFTRWVNDYLSERPPHEVESLKTDLQNGINLIVLLEVISDRPFGRYNKKPRSKYHKMENITQALEFIKAEGIKIVNIGTDDIFEGNMRIILGLIWTLILRYEIKVSGMDDAGNELLEWVRSKIPEYDIKNFTKDWNDGRAVCGLVNAICPGLIPDHFDKAPADALSNATQGIDLADDRLKVDKLILAEEMVHPKVDRLAMMTYIAQFRNITSDDIVSDASLCKAYGEGLVRGVVAEDAPFTVEVPAKVTSELEVKVAGPDDAVPVKTEKDAAGNYQCVYVPKTPGTHQVSILVGGLHIPQSPFEVPVLEPSAARCKAYGDGLVKGVAGDKGEFNVDVPEDVDGPGKLNIKVVGPEDDAPCNVTDDGKGHYSVDYTPTTPGEYEVHVTLKDDHIPGSIFHVTVAERPSKRCKAYGPGLEAAVVGDRAPFTVEVPTDLPQDSIKLAAKGPDGAPVELEVGQSVDGKRACSYIPETPGDVTIDVTYDDEHIPGSTFVVPVQQKSLASRSRAYGPGLEGGRVNDDACFVVETPAEEGVKEKMTIKVKGPGGEVPAEVVERSAGVFDVVYVPKDVGKHFVEVSIEDEHVPGSEFEVMIEQMIAALRCSAYGPGLQEGLLDFESKFWVKAPSDIKLDGILTVKIMCPDGEPLEAADVSVAVCAERPEEMEVLYTPRMVGPHGVDVLVEEVHIPKSTFTVPIEGPKGVCQVYFTTTSFSSKVKGDIDQLEKLWYIKRVHLRPDFEPWHAMDMMPKHERDAVYKEAGVRTLPLVFIDGNFIGGYDEIEELNEIGELDKLLRLDTVHLLTPEQHMQRLLNMGDGDEVSSAPRTHFCGDCGYTKITVGEPCAECGASNPVPFTPEDFAKKLRFAKVEEKADPTQFRTGRKWVPPAREEYVPASSGNGYSVAARDVTPDNIESDDMFLACYHGDAEMVEALLKAGVDPNMLDEDGNTPWRAALENKQDHLTAILVKHGATFEEDDFFIAVYNDQLEVVKAMIDKNVDINRMDEEGVTPLMIAFQEEHGKIARYLRVRGGKLAHELIPPRPENDADIDPDDFFMAVSEGSIPGVRKFLSWGLDPNAKDEEGTSLLQIAMGCGHKEIVKMLARGGAKGPPGAKLF